ncbi:MAG: hypothetical protein DRR08_25790 [Candidatus Parabeggiatoa sp. nov. 2]|nr:MAG: hypothetical protein DRR08_25790 [Gammaproteobacteria bacterium]
MLFYQPQRGALLKPGATPLAATPLAATPLAYLFTYNNKTPTMLFYQPQRGALLKPGATPLAY